MKLCTAFVLLLLLSLPTLAQGNSLKIADLNWLTGCWQSSATDGPIVSAERWWPWAGNMMMGGGQTVKGDTTVEFEYLRIVQDGPNVLYIAKPSQNAGETSFKAVKLSSQEVVFENPEHDFPQRIIYRRNGEKLTARIEGTNNGKAMGIDFPKIRIKCE